MSTSWRTSPCNSAIRKVWTKSERITSNLAPGKANSRYVMAQVSGWLKLSHLVIIALVQQSADPN